MPTNLVHNKTEEKKWNEAKRILVKKYNGKLKANIIDNDIGKKFSLSKDVKFSTPEEVEKFVNLI